MPFAVNTWKSGDAATFGSAVSLVPDWLDRNQLTHQEMNGALSLSGTDLTAVDWRDDHQLQAWIFGHYLEHYNARAALAI